MLASAQLTRLPGRGARPDPPAVGIALVRAALAGGRVDDGRGSDQSACVRVRPSVHVRICVTHTHVHRVVVCVPTRVAGTSGRPLSSQDGPQALGDSGSQGNCGLLGHHPGGSHSSTGPNVQGHKVCLACALVEEDRGSLLLSRDGEWSRGTVGIPTRTEPTGEHASPAPATRSQGLQSSGTAELAATAGLHGPPVGASLTVTVLGSE